MEHHNVSDDESPSVSRSTIPNTNEPLLSDHQTEIGSVTSMLDTPSTAIDTSRDFTTSSAESRRTPRRRSLWLSNPIDPTVYDTPAGSIGADGHRDATVREYCRSRQRTRILLNSSTRVLFTMVLCALCAVVLWLYQRKSSLTTQDVQWLTTTMTALPLLVGLNYRSSLHSYAKVFRWRVLASWGWSP